MSTLPYGPLNSELDTVLDKLRLKIQLYLFFHGVALVVLALCLGFFATLSLDWLYFQMSYLELPLAIRILMAMAMVGAIAWVLAHQVVLRLLKGKKSQSLALILERRFPELNDRLITAVELNGAASEYQTPLTQHMLQETIREVSRSVNKLNLSDVFDWKPLIQGWVAAAVLLFGVGTVAAAMPQSFDRWTRAFVQFERVYWLRETSLEVVVLAEPGDRIRQFEGRVYKHPAGADLTLRVTVPAGTNPLGSEWIVPDEVEIDYAFLPPVGGGDRQPLARRGERQFQFKMNSVLNSFEFWISGNDYINRQPYRIEIVEAPKADNITLECDYPDYMKRDSYENGKIALDERKLIGKQIRIPEETAFVLNLETNKPLRNVILQTDAYEISLGHLQIADKESSSEELTDELSMRLVQEDGSYGKRQSLPSQRASAMIGQKRQTFRLPFVISNHSESEIAARNIELPAALGQPWLLAPDSELKVYLEDEDGIISAEPKRFTILGVVDEPPKIETELTGIGSSITNKALIPVQGIISDDFGLVKARFDFKVDDATEFRLRPFQNSPNSGRDLDQEGYVQSHQIREFYENREPDPYLPFERFRTSELELKPGQKLILTVYAVDNDDLNGPHEMRGRNYTFTIVTEDELLAILHDREINLRRQFEQIISEVEATREDLLKNRGKTIDLVQLQSEVDTDAEDYETQRIHISNVAERARHQIGKNRTETTAVKQSFKRILDELLNNRVHTPEQNERIEKLILEPLEQITEELFENADVSAGLLAQKLQSGEDPLAAMDETTAALSQLLAKMREVMEQISDLAEFHEAVQELRNLIKEQTEIREKTEKKQQDDVKKLKDSLKKLGI